nr:putative reverse transcriptase, RNA-dependent DNA polymerase, Gag-polypeptide of LTR copia-type [Tanacetum cinerariifolium]
PSHQETILERPHSLEESRPNDCPKYPAQDEHEGIDFQNKKDAHVREKQNKTRPAHLNDYEVRLPSSVNHAQPSADQQPSTNGTWTIEDLPTGKRPIDSKLVCKIKYKPNGKIERYKARLIAKGYTQMEGVHYHDTFAPIAKLVTVRCLLAIAIKKEWIIHQLDVNNSFLHGDLIEEIYMRVPHGYGKIGGTKVCRLRKSIYDLKQASRNWYQKFTSTLLDLRFKRSYADHWLFIYKEGYVFADALIYVDDVIIVRNNQDKIQGTKDCLAKQFSIKDLGPLKYFLGIKAA